MPVLLQLTEAIWAEPLASLTFKLAHKPWAKRRRARNKGHLVLIPSDMHKSWSKIHVVVV